MKADIEKKYNDWLVHATADPDLIAELEEMVGDEAVVSDAFYRDLEFGTGGLRGVIGAGTNRMNVYTVAKASQGLADYVIRHFPEEKRTIAISRDSRIKSDVFAKTAASVFTANGIAVEMYEVIMPTPCLSFAVRYLHCAAGVMITASHNPSKYNGYKVYGADGCQITTEAAAEILEEIEALDIFSDVTRADFDEALRNGQICWIDSSVEDAFIAEVKKQSVLGNTPVDRDVTIVYSPLNGTGREPVLRVLRESGFSNITVVKEQEMPEGHFPTCPYPNPEIKEAMALGTQYAARTNADLLLATDPDCDRVGIAVKDTDGSYRLLTGNETGMLLLDFICARRLERGTMPANPVMVKTIVTTDMAEQIADHYGVRTINVLTGFKFIGEQIGLLEKTGNESAYIFGMEESYGYLTGTYVRDKDAVDAAFMIAEMFAYYKTRGTSLLQKLDELYATYGCRLNTLHSYTFEGESGFDTMTGIMQTFRTSFTSIVGLPVERVLDYADGLDGLPKSNVLKFLLADGSSVVVRPSGTEPKLKLYISIKAEDWDACRKMEQAVARETEKRMGM